MKKTILPLTTLALAYSAQSVPTSFIITGTVKPADLEETQEILEVNPWIEN